MWAGVVLVLLAGAPACRAPYSAYQYEESDSEEEDDTDFYDLDYGEDITTTTVTTDGSTTDLEPLTRNRRYGRYETIRTLNPDEIHDVKGLLNEILYGTKMESLAASPALELKNSYTDIYDYVTDKKILVQNFNETEPELKRFPSRNIIIRKRISTDPSPKIVVQHWSPEATMGRWRPESTAIRWSPTRQRWSSQATSTYVGAMVTVQHWNTEDADSAYVISTTTDEAGSDSSTTTDANIQEADVQQFISIGDKPHIRQGPTTSTTTPSTTTTTTRRPTTVTTTTTVTTKRPTTTKSPVMDINAIIAIIANLTYDYEWNLTERFNLTLIEHGVPTCPTPTTVTTTTTTPPAYDFSNTSVVSKCFVCGLKAEEIPRRAYCADAFAGDFLPLVPVDPRARGQIAKFRKYCRFLDVHNYVENPSESRSIYGRFTGGCGVRWTDLTGVYTQRTCRNRYKPLMGKHFASKRMAKLELALINVENGCIISPMASLLPLSRGISLYARFHACVCTGNWCNKAIRKQQWKAYITILWYWLTNRVQIT